MSAFSALSGRRPWLLLVVAFLCLSAPVAGAAQSAFDHFTTGFELLGMHRDVPCASCHVGGIFKGTPTDCAACHTAGSRVAASAKPTSHILSTSDCAQCHTTFGWKPVATFNHRNVIGTCSSCHNNVATTGKSPSHVPTTADCGACHVVNAPWNKLTYPPNHIPTSKSSTCSNCHKGNDFSVVPSLTDIHAFAPSTSGDCAQCHGPNASFYAIPKTGFSIVGIPADHVPLTANGACESCHVGAGSSIAATPVVDGAKFAHSAMSHAGITTCVACHGPGVTGSTFVGVTSIVVMPPTSPMGAGSHIPSATACESCHLASMPSKPVPAVASRTVPGTLFQTPAPTTAQVHGGITSNCSTCHESGAQWLDMTANYPLMPATLTPGTAQYLGFHSRPGKTATATSVADAVHPAKGDCSSSGCHGTNIDFFSGQLKPPNHIPYAATATCASCHKNPDFSVVPAIADIHANAESTSANCAQCHGAATAPTFAIPAVAFAIKTTPSNHVPTTAACESCHVGAGSSIAATPVPNGAKFANSVMSHAGITTGCATCHGPKVTGTTFYGISNIVVMPATAPMGVGAHIPSSTTCESCHLGSTPSKPVPANAAVIVPGSLFQTPIPTTAQIHGGITGNCATCHDSGSQWLDMTADYPLVPGTLTVGVTKYLGFHSRPGKVATATSLVDGAHPATGDCSSSNCHGTNVDYFSGQVKPANHIPYAATAACASCHKVADFSVMPAIADIHANLQNPSANCTQCHGSTTAPTFAIPAAKFSIVTTPANHVPTTAACESCHVGAGSSVPVTPVPNGAKFANSAMSHAGITTGCATCHGPTITGSSFYGITKIIVMPPTSPRGASAHIPTSTTCEACHLGSTPSALVPGNATLTVPGSKFEQPAPTTAMIHTGLTSTCTTCHEAGYVWLDMTAIYPLNPGSLVAGTTQYFGFQTRPGATGSTTNVADPAHPTSGDCQSSNCHGTNVNFFASQIKPANHIPYAASATCANCHTTSNFATMPTLANIHAYAPSTSTNCTQCHGPTTAPTFAIPAANFSIVTTPANHVPTTAACESCHVGAGSSIAATPVPNGAKFSNSLMSHAGITTGCATCHGPTITGSSFYGITKIIAMPATSPRGASAHIPTSTTCETCHLGSTPSTSVPANATLTVPGSKFEQPAPTTAMIHTGLTSTCTTCHEAGYVWLDMTAIYPLNPGSLVAGTTQYFGFQTRPGATGSTTNVADPAHPTSGDCQSSNCHGTNVNFFASQIKPANHIPYAASATCANCHTTSNFATMPTLANIHAYAPSTSTNCTQCHGPTTAPTFAIPAANFSIVTTPANHVPTTAACESCHVGAGSSVPVTPVPNGAKFSNSLMSHSGITTGCATCHGPAITGSSFYGISKIVVMPASSPVGAASHIPSNTTCETCHLGSTPAASVPANATKTPPGTLFLAPVPTTVMIHTGVTSNCQACHEKSYVWMGVSNYPISPTSVTGNSNTQYVGFQTRPFATATQYSVADAGHPTTGDCSGSSCHGTNTNFFSGMVKPVGHIPTLANAACSLCHTTGNFAVYTSDMSVLHSGVATTCSTCHADKTGPWYGPTGPGTFTILKMSDKGLHIPITNAGLPVECSGCHKTVTTFTGTIMSHAAIGDTATSAAGNACDACHEKNFGFYGVTINFYRAQNHDNPTHALCGPAGTPTAPNVQICPPSKGDYNGGSDCLQGCHQHYNQKNFGNYKRAPRAHAAAATTPKNAAPQARPGQATGTGGLRTPVVPGERMLHVDHRAPGLPACQTCHNGTAATGKGAAHAATRGACGDCHSTVAWQPVLRIDHADVLATCVSCHNGTAATGKPPKHPLSGADCDRCHTTSAWKPAAFDHSAVVSGTCATCHTGAQAPGKPASHVATTLSCDACHYVLGWTPTKPPKPVVAPASPGKRTTPRLPPLPRPLGPSPAPRL